MTEPLYIGCVYRATLIVGGKRNRRSYIGKSIAGMNRRRAQHYAQARYGLSTPFAAALLAYVPEAFEWEVLFLSDEDDMLKRVEIEQIASHKAQRHKLYNLSAGGDGCKGVKWTAEERDRRMTVNAERKAKGLTAKSIETRAKLSTSAKGRPGPQMSAEGLARISAAKKAYWERRKKQNLPPIPKDASGRFVKA